MKTKITADNLAAIDAHLDKVHGRASTHVATAQSLLDLAAKAEQSLAQLGLRVRDRAGASLLFASGRTVPAKYKYPRRVTSGVLQRASRDWYLVQATTDLAWPSQGGKSSISLTSEQDRLVVEAVRARYSVTDKPLFQL